MEITQPDLLLLDCHPIIEQLIKVNIPQDRAIREEDIKYLTPINKVSDGPTMPGEPAGTFLVGKETPSNSELIFQDILSHLTSEVLYDYYFKLEPKEFIQLINTLLFRHIRKNFLEANKRNVKDSDNIWFNPSTEFINWFQKNNIEIESDVDIIDKEFNPRGDYTLIYHKNQVYEFTGMQANIIKFMYEKHQEGKVDFFQGDLIEEVNSEQSYLHQIFKGNPALNSFIIKTQNNFYKLDL